VPCTNLHVQPLGGIRDLDGDSNETVKLVSVHGSLGLKLKYLQRAECLENCSTDKKTSVTQQLASDLDQEYVDQFHTAVVQNVLSFDLVSTRVLYFHGSAVSPQCLGEERCNLIINKPSQRT
jgi:hypothetical protein